MFTCVHVYRNRCKCIDSVCVTESLVFPLFSVKLSHRHTDSKQLTCKHMVLKRLGTMMFIILLALIFHGEFHHVIGEGVVVEVEQGQLSGNKLESVLKDGTYYNFRGIPYAKAPVGSLRFKAPQPPSPWEGVRDATEHGAVCPQVDYNNVYHPGSEDCLFLNAYTPQITADPPLPVMFYIHGGGYKSGSGNIDSFGPDFLVRKDVVLVTINYRLDALGFLCLDTEDVPGNAGLKDQVAALKWVKKNIRKFGGDPDNITIFGDSAGGASVGFHAISPLAKGLFKRAIAMSGSPYNDWSIPYKPARRAFVLGQMLGHQTRNATDLLKFLQEISYEKLVNTAPTVLTSEELTHNILKMYPFTPVYEKDFGQERFLDQEPVGILNSGNVNDVDIMFGYTALESLVDVPVLEEYLLARYNRYPELLVPSKILIKCDPDTILKISDKIHEYFFGQKSIEVATIKEMIEYSSNATIAYDVYRYFRAFPNLGNKARYFYKFSSLSKRNVYSAVGAKYGLYGAAHQEDELYLFDHKSLNLTLEKNTPEYEMVDQMTSLYTNFAKFGNPTPDSSLGVTWPQFDNKTLAYVDIGRTLTVSNAPDEVHMQFWKRIHEDAGISF